MDTTKMIIHKEIVVPDSSEIFILGDIHGCLDLMNNALELAGYTDNDYVFCVGDLVDRGTQNLEVLSKFLHNPKFISVMGNHDAFISTKDYDNWAYNGGIWAVKLGLSDNDIDLLSKDITEKLPVFITIKHRGHKYGIVHGGIPFTYPDRGIQPIIPNWDKVVSSTYKQEDLGNFYWDRNVIDEIFYNIVSMNPGLTKQYKALRYYITNAGSTIDIPNIEGVDLVFHGHTGVPYPLRYGNRVYLDTGGVFNNKLTAAHVQESVVDCYTTPKSIYLDI